jgi:Domain of unknown function (DUF243)
VTQGDTQVIDISGGGGGGGVIYKPVIREGPAEITKHFYVHEAPEEASNVRIEEKEIQVRPQKHYKIIFIKAPSGGSSYAGSNAAIFPQNEEKTIVYVLSKKPEDVNDAGELPTPPPAVTSKPEVFFVKYKNQQEAEGAISQIQESFREGGAGYNSPGAFAQSLGASSGSAGSSSLTLDEPVVADTYSAGSYASRGNNYSSQQAQMIEVPQQYSAFRRQ